MQYLADRQLAAKPADLGVISKGTENLSRAEGRALVTIDDGFRSLYEVAWPVMSEYKIEAIAFVTASELGLGSAAILPKDARQEPRLTPGQLREMSDQGLIVGSHSWSHRSMAQLLPAEAREEAVRSKLVLQGFLGRTVDTFAYPFGTRADFSRETESILAEAGYRYVFTSQHSAFSQATNPYRYQGYKLKAVGGRPCSSR